MDGLNVVPAAIGAIGLAAVLEVIFLSIGFDKRRRRDSNTA